MSENTVQKISNSEGDWLEKIEYAKSIAVDIDVNELSEKTTCTFKDGSTLTFKALAYGFYKQKNRV